MSDLEEIFLEANENHENVAVLVQMDGYIGNELIINPHFNILQKLGYYKEVYDEQLNHKHAKGIRIVNAYSGATFEEIEKQVWPSRSKETNDKLLTIELDTLEAVPKVIFKGEEVTGGLMKVAFTWITKDDRNAVLESPYIRIESVEGFGTKNPAMKVQGYNEPIQDDHTTALMLAVVGLNKALELHQSMNAASNEEEKVYHDGEIFDGGFITAEEAINNITKANKAMPSAKDLMTEEQREELYKQAIESNERRIEHLETFLNRLPLDSEVNKTIALELGSAIGFIEKDTEELRNLKGSGE